MLVVAGLLLVLLLLANHRAGIGSQAAAEAMLRELGHTSVGGDRALDNWHGPAPEHVIAFCKP